MKNFKKIYYIIYILFTVFLFYLAYDLVNVLDTLKKWGWYTYFSELPKMGSRFIYTVMFLLVFELLYENYHHIKSRSKIKSLEKEVTAIKAKLYDSEHPAKVEEASTISTDADVAPEDEEDKDE